MKLILFLAGIALASALPERGIKTLMPEVDVLPGAVPNDGADSKIVGGQEATPHEFPWQVALTISTPGGTYFCGGSLISYEWVVTAAHCTTGSTSVSVLAGAHNRNQDESTQQTLRSSQIITHESYNPRTLHNDIGLVKVSRAFSQSYAVSPIRLPNRNDPHLGAGVSVTMSGWGKDSDGPGGVTNELRKTTSVTITDSQCAQTYGQTTASGDCLCTSTTGGHTHGTCSGDSGGPLMYREGSQYVHRGITSFVSSAGCESGYPDGFHRTVDYRDWIQGHTGV